MIASPHNQGDSLGDSHAGNGAVVRQVQSDLQGVWGLEGHCILHRTGGNAALPGQDGSVCHKSSQMPLGKLLADVMLVLAELFYFLDFFRVQVFVKQAGGDAFWQEIKQDFDQLSGIDAAAVGGEAHFHAD